MPKTPSNKLFQLIQSLSGSEKRYFKIFVQGKAGKANKYIQLFDEMDKQEVFDEEKLKAIIYGDKPIESRKYSELKAYLYNLILKGLQSYDEKTSVDYRLKGMLLNVRTLFKRSLFEDCKEQLQKAKKVALKYEQFNTILEILNWEKKIAYAQTDIAFLDKKLGIIELEELKNMEQLRNISAYRNFFFKFLVSIRKDVSRRKKQMEALKEIIEHPLLQNVENATSHEAKILYHRTYSIYYFSTRDFDNFYESSKLLIGLMQSQPHLLKEDVSEYISALNNLIISCGWMEKIDEVRENLEKFKQIQPITYDDELKVHRQYYMNKFRLCISTGEFQEGLQELKRHKAEIKKFDQSLFNKHTFFLQYFCIYFGVGDYNNALDSLNEWLGLSKNVERQDLQSLARILNLIIHFELGNTTLLESLLRSTYRYLNKENRLFEFERKILEFIRAAMRVYSKRELKQAFEALKQDFESLSKTPAFGIFQMFDIMSWLESKITSKTFEKVVQEKFENRVK